MILVAGLFSSFPRIPAATIEIGEDGAWTARVWSRWDDLPMAYGSYNAVCTEIRDAVQVRVQFVGDGWAARQDTVMGGYPVTSVLQILALTDTMVTARLTVNILGSCQAVRRKTLWMKREGQ